MTERGSSDVLALASPPITIDGGATAPEAAQLMGTQHIGSVVVTEDGQPVGLVTDRDLALATLLRPAGSEVPTVGSVASRPLLTVNSSATLVEATTLFQRHCVRRAGVMDTKGELVGVLSADSVLQALGRTLGDMAEALAREFSEERHPSAQSPSTLGPE
jgi:CBS domain-containing protein